MSQVKALEQQLTDAKAISEEGQRAQRLARNPDFRKLIIEGFMRDDAARFVQLSEDPALGENERQDALRMAQASGHLKRFLSMTIRMGQTAEGQISDIDDALVEAQAEEDEAAIAGITAVGNDYDNGQV